MTDKNNNEAQQENNKAEKPLDDIADPKTAVNIEKKKPSKKANAKKTDLEKEGLIEKKPAKSKIKKADIAEGLIEKPEAKIAASKKTPSKKAAKAANAKVKTEGDESLEKKLSKTTAPKENKEPKKAKAASIKKAPVLTEAPTVVPSAGIEPSIQEKQNIEAAIKLNTVNLTLKVRYYTVPGQMIFITGKHELFGNGDLSLALPMQYLDETFWQANIQLNKADLPEEGIVYNYVLKNADGSVVYDWGNDKVLSFEHYSTENVVIVDAWNYAGFYQNAFYTEPFQKVLLQSNFTAVKAIQPPVVTHIFKLKAPLLEKGQALFITGNNSAFGNWQESKPVLMSRKQEEDFWTVAVDLSAVSFPVVYKYGIYDVEKQKAITLENGKDRYLDDRIETEKQTIVNDGFIVMPDHSWKGAGVAVPVFSLRSEKSMGTGEFSDLKLLADWAKKTGLKLIQILPVNDTTATHSWMDSYPYAAISAFALHPMYLNLDEMVEDSNKEILEKIRPEQRRLNQLDSLDYEEVNNLKWDIFKEVYPLQKKQVFASEDYQQFFNKNQHWLKPYAAFCYLRDKYDTADFNHWPAHKNYVAEEINALSDNAEVRDAIGIHYFLQYHLHLQLKAATEYAHKNGVIIKGDIPIGIYRNSVDAWQQPALFNMDMQAGAPPDDFAIKGQNWGFPTYNWEQMTLDGFAWWKQRFEQMSYYYDAFRIDHILGFFRIWSIPIQQVEGIMGYFQPAIPVDVHEMYEKQINFSYNRFTKPYINDQILYEVFGDQQDYVRHHFVEPDNQGNFQMKSEFATQRQVENYFATLEENAHNQWLKQALFNLISNVILFEAEGSNSQKFHIRFGVENTASFRHLDADSQYRLKQLYEDYFFRRQDDLWRKEGMQKLTALKRETNMLVFGEDLGMVPSSVPDVLAQLGILSIEVQRMPKNHGLAFFNPKRAPYLSVVTPATHDMSTIRGWWEEDRNTIQQFYHDQLGQQGYAPFFSEAWINKAIVVQHLESPAMWSIFLLQDLLGINKDIRRENPHEERINVPAITPFYWEYRMHLNLETLINATEFNEELAACIKESGR